MSKLTKILIAGEGGQGVQTIAQLLAITAKEEGKHSTYIPNFGVEQRGGVSIAFIQISDRPIPYPKFEKADILVNLSQRSEERTKPYLDKHTYYIYDDSLIISKISPTIKHPHTKQFQHRKLVEAFLALPAAKIAKDKLDMKVFNMIILGGIIATIKSISGESVEKILDAQMADKFKKHPKLRDLNHKALEIGIRLAQEKHHERLDKTLVAKEPEIFEDAKNKITVYPDLCKGCGLCIEICPKDVLSFSDKLGMMNSPMPKADVAKCISCLLCEQTCPECAIRVDKKQK